MRNVHHWTKEAASKVLSKFNIRKRKDKETKTKDYHPRRRCPLGTCQSIVLRLLAHLQKVKNLEKSSKGYLDALENAHARVAPDPKHPAIRRWQEERFQTKEWSGRGESMQSRPIHMDNLTEMIVSAQTVIATKATTKMKLTVSMNIKSHQEWECPLYWSNLTWTSIRAHFMLNHWISYLNFASSLLVPSLRRLPSPGETLKQTPWYMSGWHLCIPRCFL